MPRNKIEEYDELNFKKCIYIENMRRANTFARFVIGFDTVLAVMDILTSLMKIDNRFKFINYLFMYIIMIFINIIFIILTNKINEEMINTKKLKKIEIGFILYITIMMCWGSIISLMDQNLYGQIIVFMINMITCSVMFYLDLKKFLIPYCTSVLIIIIGLPFFQKSNDILIGDYINIFIFSIISMVCSQLLFYNYCNDFKNKAMLNKANKKMRRLSLFDELTSLPNRRSLNNVIESVFDCYDPGTELSVIMMDIDNFKLFNDTYGHSAGDKALISAAEHISAVAEIPNCFAARYGGEEFIVIAINNDKSQISVLAENIRKEIENSEIRIYDREKMYITLSLGTATVKIYDKEDVVRCIELADKALYKAKKNGRNCVICN